MGGVDIADLVFPPAPRSVPSELAGRANKGDQRGNCIHLRRLLDLAKTSMVSNWEKTCGLVPDVDYQGCGVVQCMERVNPVSALPDVAA